jgi:hypothetical protein
MEVGTIIAALITLKFIRFPFLTFPIAFSLWYMSMDLTPLLFGKPEFTWQQRLWVSLFFGLLMSGLFLYRELPCGTLQTTCPVYAPIRSCL